LRRSLIGALKSRCHQIDSSWGGQRRIARRFGMSEDYLSNILNERRGVSVDQIMNLLALTDAEVEIKIKASDTPMMNVVLETDGDTAHVYPVTEIPKLIPVSRNKVETS
jgi:transcriptional regulator with XRE-family HTH domain